MDRWMSLSAIENRGARLNGVALMCAAIEERRGNSFEFNSARARSSSIDHKHIGDRRRRLLISFTTSAATMNTVTHFAFASDLVVVQRALPRPRFGLRAHAVDCVYVVDVAARALWSARVLESLTAPRDVIDCSKSMRQEQL